MGEKREFEVLMLVKLGVRADSQKGAILKARRSYAYGEVVEIDGRRVEGQCVGCEGVVMEGEDWTETDPENRKGLCAACVGRVAEVVGRKAAE